MSEKTADRALARPATTAVEQPGQAALSPAERAERELAKIDEEMDAIMGKTENRDALKNAPDAALQPPAGRTITPDVSAPVEAGALNHLAMNVFVPGLGSLVRGRYGLGMAQLGMALAAIPMLFIKFWLAVLLVVFAYGWSVVSGIGFLSAGSKRAWK